MHFSSSWVTESYSPSRPFVVFGLLQYEHKMTVLNLQITRDNAYEEPVRSKVYIFYTYDFPLHHLLDLTNTVNSGPYDITYGLPTHGGATRLLTTR